MTLGFFVKAPIGFVCGGLLLSACSLTPEYARPEVEAPAWRKQIASTEVVEEAWWNQYGDEQLVALIERGLANNHTLKASLARIEQARAELDIAGASLLPSAQAGASGAGRSVIADSADSRPFTVTPQGGFATRDWIAGATISYELDLFGKNRAGRAGRAALLDKAMFEADALQLVLSAEIARSYFLFLTLLEREAIATQKHQNASAALESMNAELATGGDQARQIAAQGAVVAERAAQIEAISLGRDVTRNALAVLVGVPPQSFEIDRKGLAALQFPKIATLQPVQLLERRPDLRAAEARLVAANADIGRAKAALYPTINLGAGLAAAQPIIGSPSAIAAFVGAITAPLFEGGRLRGQVDKAEAYKQEVTEQYFQSVLEAYREAENALAATKWLAQQSKSHSQAVKSRATALEISQQQFGNGMISYRDVLGDQDGLLDAQDEKLMTDLDRLSASVDLVKAMGGGWHSK